MINKRQKGNRNQLKTKQLLEGCGWLVHMIQHSRWSKDLFGLFDGFAIKSGKVLFFQVKSNSKPNPKPFKEWAETYNIPVAVFNWVDYKGVCGYMITPVDSTPTHVFCECGNVIPVPK